MLRSRSSESGSLFGIFIIIKTLLAFLAATCRLVTHPGSSVIWLSSYFTNPTPSSSLMSRLNKFMYDEQKEETERKSERVMTREKKETYIGLMSAGGTLKETNEKQTTRSRDTDTNCLVYIYMREKKVSISWLRGRKQKGRRERGRER